MAIATSNPKAKRIQRQRRINMKIVVIGGTGLIGSKTVAILRQRGHEVVAASVSYTHLTLPTKRIV